MSACVFYECDRAKLAVLEPVPAMLVLVRADADPLTIARQLRKLAAEIERAPRSLPAIRSDDGPSMVAYVAETSEGLKTLEPA